VTARTPRFLASARAEAETAARWYEAREAGLGGDFVAELERAVEQILTTPDAWPICQHDDRARRFLLSRFPYAVVYLVQDDALVVVAVAHGKRRPGYWRGRPHSE